MVAYVEFVQRVRLRKDWIRTTIGWNLEDRLVGQGRDWDNIDMN